MALSESFFVRIKHALPFAINSHRQRMLQKKRAEKRKTTFIAVLLTSGDILMKIIRVEYSLNTRKYFSLSIEEVLVNL